MKIDDVLARVAVSIVAVLLVASVAFSEERAGAMLSWVKLVYGYSNWAGSTATNYHHTLRDWVPDFRSLRVTNVFSTNVTQRAGVLTQHTYGIVDQEAQAVVMVHMTEFTSVLSAHEDMMVFFSGCNSRQPFTNAVDVGQSIGDRGFVGLGNPAPFFFVRNNIFVRVIAEGSTNTVSRLAHFLDAQILDASLQ